MRLRYLFPCFALVNLLNSGLLAQDWRINLPQPGGFGASMVAVAPNGDVFVTDSRQTPDSLVLSRVSASGSLLWQKQIQYGGVWSTGGQKVGCGGLFFEPDGSLYLITNRNSAFALGHDLVHIAPDGTEISRTGSTQGWIQRCMRLPGGDFMITRTPGYGLRRVRPDGSTVWESTNAGGASVNFTNTIAHADNGDFFMAVDGFYQSGSGFIIIRTDSVGAPIAIYDMDQSSSTFNIAKGTDGNFLVAGTSNTGEIFWRILSPDGTTLSDHSHDDALDLLVYDAIALPDGYLLAGKSGTSPCIWRLDTAGNLAFSRSFLPGESGCITSLSPGNNTNEILASGYVQVGPGASDSDVFVMKFEMQPLSDLGLVRGTVRLDPEADCQADITEAGFGAVPLRAIAGIDTFYTLTNAAGAYYFRLDTSTWSIEVLDYHPYLQPCGTAQIFTPVAGDTLNADFWVQEIYHCPLMEVSLAAPPLRRCFPSTYAVKYCNIGTETAFDSRLKIVLDPRLMYTGSTLPLSNSSGDTLFFELGNLAPGDCNQFNLSVEMLHCDSIELGQTLCISAYISPDSICGDFSNWTGASMAVGAHCDGDSVRMFVTNRGTAPTSNPIDYIITEDNVILFEGGNFFAPSDTFWSIQPANGATWRIESNQEPGHPGFSRPAVTIEACQSNQGASFSTGYLGMFSLDDADLSVDISCNEVIGSFDPNAKSAFPKGYESAHYIKKGDELEYLIQFQNTGTDTAFTVVVRDTLPVWLDPASVHVGASSHRMDWQMEGPGILTFTFNKILLPDSNVNEAASHGWLSYRVAQKNGLENDMEIRNRAAIYFDFNDPIFTDYTLHTIGENFVTVSVLDPGETNTPDWQVYPNPATGGNWLHLKENAYNGYTFRLFDVWGRQICSQSVGDNRVLLPASMDEGVFVFRIEKNGRILGAGRLLTIKR